MPNGNLNYNLTLEAMDLATGQQIANVSLLISETEFILEIEPYAEYSLTVIPETVVGGGSSSSFTVQTEQGGTYTSLPVITPCIHLGCALSAAPTAPTAFNVSDTTNTTVLLAWGPPVDANGVVSSYTIVLLNEDAAVDPVELGNATFSHEFQNLAPFTYYSAIAYASTLGGPGQNATVSFTTEIGSMCF